MTPMPHPHARFRRMAFITLVAVYLLIAVGASVRATGAGMGCPDWPKCFDMWIPPTDVSQLPENYQEIYAHRGYAETEFNAVKTWTEYLNRLLGATVGLLVAGMAASSVIRLWNEARAVFAWSLGAFLLTGFAGWLGKIVVENNLSPVTITLHMATALLIVLCIVAAYARAGRDYYPKVESGATLIAGLALLCLGLSLVQIFMGTQVRQEVDLISDALGESARNAWAERLPLLFYVHRSFSFVLVAANAALLYAVYKHARQSAPLTRSALAVAAVIALEIASGAILYYGGFPAYLQPVHLLCAALMFGGQVHLLFAAKRTYGILP